MLIADNGVGSILVFESCGKLKKKIGTKGKGTGQFKELSSVCIGPNGEIIVADTRIIVFSSSGEFLREIGASAGAGARGRFCGVSVDRQGHLLAARMEKARSYIQVSMEDYVVLGLLVTRLGSYLTEGKYERLGYCIDYDRRPGSVEYIKQMLVTLHRGSKFPLTQIKGQLGFSDK